MYFVEWYWRALSLILEYYWFYVVLKKKEESFLFFIFECDFQDGVVFCTEWRILTRSLNLGRYLLFAYLLSVGFVIETRL